MQLGFFIDINKCTGCRSCEMACKQEKGLAPSQRFRRVTLVEDTALPVSFYLSLACNHCQNPECMRVCPTQTYHKRRDGVVIHDPGNCSGCCTCVRACPYGAPQFDPRNGKVDKCDLCIGRLLKGKAPACVEACPNSALLVLDLDVFPDTDARTVHLGGAPASTLWEWIPTLPDPRLTRPSVRFPDLTGPEVYLIGSSPEKSNR